MTTRRDIVVQAYGELGLYEYNYDLSPEELSTARKRLDSMMAQWELRVSTGYYMPANPDDSDLDDDTNLPQGVIDGVALNLAIQLAPGLGKTPSALTMVAAKQGKDAVFAFFAVIPQKQYSGNLPVGSGNKPLPGWNGYFKPQKQLTATYNGEALSNDQGDPFTTVSSTS
tara:strand:+ start:37667 stop:38176 length:510 start_codon:yes stop_codon:yes gene_type:complete